MALRPLIALAALALANSAAAQAPIDWASAQPVEVTLRSFSFAPATLNLRAGVPISLIITDAKGGHSFSAPAFFAAAQVASEDRGKIDKGQVDLHGGESVTIHLIPAEGTYKLTCTHFMHNAFGMKGVIIVK